MAETSIEWTEVTWNPSTGCDQISPGCDHCYALTLAKRLKAMGQAKYQTDGDPRTSGPGFGLTVHPDVLSLPLTWRKPRRIFVNSMSDLFHDDIPDRFIARVFAVMALAPQHTFQVLTKRHGRMRSLLKSGLFLNHIWVALSDRVPDPRHYLDVTTLQGWPLPNVWLGVSVEDQKWADIRIPALLETPAAVRWISAEPLLGPIDLAPDDHSWHERDWQGTHWECLKCSTDDEHVRWTTQEIPIDWVVCGGESGPGARPMHPDWARLLRDRCMASEVPFFFKQWGEWAPNGWRGIGNFNGRERLVGPVLDDMGHREVIERVGKRNAGRLLDGRTWDEYPAVPVLENTEEKP